MDEFTLPLRLKCTVSGKEVVYTSADYIRKKLEKYGGSLDRLRNEYICRDAKREMKEGKQVTQVINKIPDRSIKIDTTPVEPKARIVFKPEKLQPLTKEQSAPDVCYNPSWFLSKKPCNSCAFSKICTYVNKTNTARIS